MKKTLQINGYYTGFPDGDLVYEGTQSFPAYVAGSAIVGKKKFVTDQTVNAPVLTFHSYNASGEIVHTYFVKGSWYFTQTQQQMRAIAELRSSLFPDEMLREITFTAYAYKMYFGLVEMVAVDGSLYVIRGQHTYQKAGRLSDFIGADIQFVCFTGSPTDPHYFAYGKDGAVYSASVSIDGDYIPHFTVGQRISVDLDYMAVRPTGANIAPDGGEGRTVVTFVNAAFGIYKLHYDSAQLTQQESGRFTLPEMYKPDISMGSSFTYQMLSAEKPGPLVALPLQESEYMDTCVKNTSITYNGKLQPKTRTSIIPSAHPMAKSQSIQTTTQYLWEMKEPASPYARNRGVGLIHQQQEQVTENDLKKYNYLNRYIYGVRDMSDGKGIYYQETRSLDGLVQSASTVRDSYVKMDSTGLPILIKELVPDNGGDVILRKYIYTKGGQRLPLATFRGVSVSLGSVDEQSAHYLGFESYEDYNVSDGNLTSDFFTANKVQIVSNSYLGSQCLRFTGAGQIKCTALFHIKPEVNYLFSCYRNNNGSKWQYFEKRMLGSTFASSRIIHNFVSPQMVDHVMLREIDCEASVTIYDPTTYILKAKFNNNGVPAVFIVDKMSRIQFSYKPEFTRASSTEMYYDFTGNVAVSAAHLSGYARMLGFNCGVSNASPSGFNTLAHFSFRNKGRLISAQGASVEVGKKTALVAGSWTTNGQQVRFVRTTQNVDFRFGANSVSAYVNDLLQASSEVYLSESSCYAIAMLREFCAVYVNGKLVISHIFTEDSVITRVTTSCNDDSAGSLFLVPELDMEMNYLDYRGNCIQSQRMRAHKNGKIRVITNQNFYDRRGNLVIETLRGCWPTSASGTLQTSHQPLRFREGFASINWSDPLKPRGELSGELRDYYATGDGAEFCKTAEDAAWPYAERLYEEDASNRFLGQIPQGNIGNTLQSLIQYHTQQAYTMLGRDFADRGFDYLDRSKLSSIGGSSLSEYVIFNPLLKGFDRQISGTSPNGALSARYGRKGYLQEEDDNVKASFHYLVPGAQDSMRSLNSYGSNRILEMQGKDYSRRGLLYDSFGKARLATTEENVFQYAKYDRMGRIVQSGNVVFAEPHTLKDFYMRANDPDFPTPTDGTLTPHYNYTYDVPDRTDSCFSVGRLVSMTILPTNNYGEDIQNVYSYDNAGRVISYKTIYGNKTLTHLFNLDNAGRLGRVTYPAHTGCTANYQYGSDNIGLNQKTLI